MRYSYENTQWRCKAAGSRILWAEFWSKAECTSAPVRWQQILNRKMCHCWPSRRIKAPVACTWLLTGLGITRSPSATLRCFHHELSCRTICPLKPYAGEGQTRENVSATRDVISRESSLLCEGVLQHRVLIVWKQRSAGKAETNLQK